MSGGPISTSASTAPHLRLTLAVGAVLVAVLALAVGAADAHAANRLHKLDRQLHRLVGLVVAGPDGHLETGPPGASALVQRRGRVDFLRAGVADVKSGRPIRRNDHLRTASTGKTFSGAVALQLVDDGSLSLDSTIGETLPTLPAAWGAVTLRQLLQHTSGIPNYTKTPAWQSYVAMHLRREVSVTPEFLLSFVTGKPLEFTPGSAYEYSNSDNLVIGLMAEAATGDPYDELLRKLVFSPLRLNETSVARGLEIPRPYVHGYDVAPPAPPEDVTGLFDPSLVGAAPGGMVSTPVDLNRFIRAYASGRLIDRGTRLQQRSFIQGAAGEPPGPGHNSGGLALYRYQTNCGTVLGHTGNFPGYTVFIAATPNGRRSVVVSATEQLAKDAKPRIFKQMLRTFRLGACAALRR
jgi:D-alanyl-D-alanine carboxypeptidase